MKLHFSITAAQELRERRGAGSGRRGRAGLPAACWQLYSVFLEGFPLGTARHSQLRRWDAQLRQLFGSAVSAKFYLAMTKSMADERRSQLKQYLQNVTLDSNITNSDVFRSFSQKLQQAWKRYMDPSLDVLLMDCRALLNLLYIQGATKDGDGDALELRFEYNDSSTWQWIILYTKQAFLLSSRLKKMTSEQMMKAAKEGQEMQIKMPESMKNSKKPSIQQKQVVYLVFLSRKRFLVMPNEEGSVFEKIREEDL